MIDDFWVFTGEYRVRRGLFNTAILQGKQHKKYENNTVRWVDMPFDGAPSRLKEQTP